MARSTLPIPSAHAAAVAAFATRPAAPADVGHEPLLWIYLPPCPPLPRGCLFLVGIPLSGCTPLPAGVVDVEGELVSDVRAA